MYRSVADLMSSIFVLADSQLLQALGRFHVAIVHFPIALLLLAGAEEAWRWVRRKQEPSKTALVCIVIGGLTAVASSALGWIHKDHSDFSGTTLALHQWIGI